MCGPSLVIGHVTNGKMNECVVGHVTRVDR